MNKRTETDIRQFSFEEFIGFLFDREIPPKSEKWDPWYWHAAVLFDPERTCDYYIRLFNEPGFLLEKFSKAQLEEGFWAIPSNGFLECSVADLIWNKDLPFTAREDCVRSMFHLYRDFFAVEPLETAGGMWWDSLCWHLWHRGKKDRQRGGEDLAMQDVMFETLVKILALSSEECQRAALHGLGHIHHPETEKAVEDYINRHPSLSDEARTYALAAARFEVE